MNEDSVQTYLTQEIKRANLGYLKSVIPIRLKTHCISRYQDPETDDIEEMLNNISYDGEDDSDGPDADQSIWF